MHSIVAFIARFELPAAAKAVRAALVAWTAAAPQGAPPKEWSQPHGNAAATAFVDVAPLKSPPTERWRIDPLLAGPALSQGKLFVVVRAEGKSELRVLDPATGAAIAKAALDPPGEVFGLVASDNFAALFEPGAVTGWRLAAGELRREKSVPGSFGGEPMQCGATWLAPRGAGDGLLALDWSGGKALPLPPKCFGRPSLLLDDVIGGKPAASLLVVGTDEQGVKVSLNRFALPAGATAGALKLGPAEALFTGTLVAKDEDAPRTVLVAVQGKAGVDRQENEWCAWFGSGRGSGILRKSGLKLLEFRAPPAAKAGRLYGFDREERLIEFDNVADAINPMVEKKDLRKGAQIGAPSIARDVLFLGNWAVELGSKRVLWCLDAIEADGPAIPAGDELLVIKTKSGQLLGFGNGPVGGGATAKAGAAATAPPMPSGPALLPGSAPGIVRSDGIFVPGKATSLTDGRWRVEPEGAAAYELEAEGVALIDAGKESRRPGEESAVFQACWRVLGPRHAAALVPVLEKWRDAKLYDECRRLLDEATLDGLPPAQADELLSSITGRTPAKVAANSPVRKKCLDAELAARAKSAADLVAAAKWCSAHDAKTAATVLVARAAARSPKSPPDAALAAGWRPENFPTGDGAQVAGSTWTVWAEALLPSGATFAVLDDSARRRLSVTKFGGPDAVVLRTKNILLLSKETNPALLGPLLARGEAAIRALQRILGPSPTGLKGTAPLEVRLHLTRSEYLADFIVGSTPPIWSGGCFSPADGISRFYSKNDGVAEDDDDPLSHTLHETFAHELTHHYLDRRWIRTQPGSASGGYWMVEGFAEFAAEQALEIGRLGERYDDATVRSLDATSATAAVEMLLPLDTLLEIDQKLFHKVLEGGRFGPIQLKHTLTETYLDKRGVFYAEAAALTFFVMNRFGEAGRATYVEWLKKVYSGQPLVEPWKDLGLADLNAFKKAFREFLAGI